MACASMTSYERQGDSDRIELGERFRQFGRRRRPSRVGQNPDICRPLEMQGKGWRLAPRYRNHLIHAYSVEQAKNSEEREAADKIFYDACIVGGCSISQARLLYTGVRIGAWTPNEVESNLTPAISLGCADLTNQNRGVLNTFREIADDLAGLNDRARFATVAKIVDRHLAAKATQ